MTAIIWGKVQGVVGGGENLFSPRNFFYFFYFFLFFLFFNFFQFILFFHFVIVSEHQNLKIGNLVNELEYCDETWWAVGTLPHTPLFFSYHSSHRHACKLLYSSLNFFQSLRIPSSGPSTTPNTPSVEEYPSQCNNSVDSGNWPIQ